MSLARVITVVTAALVTVLGTASTAFAGTTPDSDSWPVGESISTLQVIAYFVGGPLLLLVIIWAVSAAVVAKSRNFVPTIPSAAELEQTASREISAH